MDNHLTERVSPKLDFELRDQQGRPLYPNSEYNLITATVPSFMYLWRMEFKKKYEPPTKCAYMRRLLKSLRKCPRATSNPMAPG